jgi:hypothetical protein
MSRAIAITLDGVLRKPLDVEAQDFGASLLFASLVENFRVIVLGTEEPEKDEHFMGVNGMVKYVRIEPLRREDGPDKASRIRAQIKRLRAEGFQFEFLVVPDPDLAKDLYADGYPVLLYIHPTFSNRSFRPDYAGGMKPWDELTSEVEYQLSVKAEQRLRENA